MIISNLNHCTTYNKNFRPQIVFKIDVQPDQINMVVLFWYLVKSDLSNVRNFTSVHWTHFLQGTSSHGHVQPVTLYNLQSSLLCWVDIKIS